VNILNCVKKLLTIAVDLDSIKSEHLNMGFFLNNVTCVYFNVLTGSKK